jgi:hypothetical protein
MDELQKEVRLDMQKPLVVERFADPSRVAMLAKSFYELRA